MELQTPDQAQLDHTAPAAQDAATPLDQTPSYQSMSPQELVDHLAVLLQQEELPERKLVENIRGQFIRRRERLDPNDKEQRESFEVQELRLEGLLSTFREHDKKRQEALEQLYAENKVKKEALLQRFEDLFKSNEEGAEFGSLYSTFTAIRDEWNALGQLDPRMPLYSTAASMSYVISSMISRLSTMTCARSTSRRIWRQSRLSSQSSVSSIA